MRKAQRRDSARAWIESGATPVTVKSYARRYGTDKYTAYDDLQALGVPLLEKDEQWAVRPTPAPKPKKRDSLGYEPDWVFDGHQVMLVIDTTPGGAPFGPVETEADHLMGECLLGPGLCPWDC